MIDTTGTGLNFRGYPVAGVSEGVLAAIHVQCEGDVTLTGGKTLADAFARAVDTAEPNDEPADWYFETTIGTFTVSIERFGGYRDDSGHHGGQWSVFLPGER